MTSRPPIDDSRLDINRDADSRHRPVEPKAERETHTQLDAMLATFQPPPVPAALRSAILASAREAALARSPSWRETLMSIWQELGGTRVVGPVFALALLAGVGLGSGLVVDAGADGTLDDLLSIALINDDYLALAP